MAVTDALSPAQQADITRACERVAQDYCFFADSSRQEDLSKLFADDGEMHLFGQVNVGPAAIEKALGAAGGGGQIRSIHSMTNHRIDVVSEAEANGTAYVTVFVADKSAAAPAAIAPLMVGIYHDTYRKTPAGWRFAKRAFEPVVTAASPPRG